MSTKVRPPTHLTRELDAASRSKHGLMPSFLLRMRRGDTGITPTPHEHAEGPVRGLPELSSDLVRRLERDAFDPDCGPDWIVARDLGITVAVIEAWRIEHAPTNPLRPSTRRHRDSDGTL